MLDGFVEEVSEFAESGRRLHKFYARHIKRRMLGHKSPTRIPKKFDDGEVTCCQNFMDWYKHEDASHIGVEQPLACTFDGEPIIPYPDSDELAEVHGRPDMYRIRGDLLEVFDWKTGADIHTATKRDAVRQLMFYAWLIMCHHEGINRVIIYSFFTRFYRNPLVEVLDPETVRREVVTLIGEAWGEVEIRHEIHGPNSDNWPARGNPYCKYCGLRGGACPITSRRRNIAPIHALPDNAIPGILERRQVLDAEIKAIDKGLKLAAEQRIKAGDEREFIAAGLYAGQRTTGGHETYEPSAVEEGMLQLGIPIREVISLVDPRTLRRYVDNWAGESPETKGALAEICEHGAMVTPTKTSIGIRKNPPEDE
jgi:hypothetical protein